MREKPWLREGTQLHPPRRPWWEVGGISPPSHHNPQPHDAMSSTRLDLPVLPDPAMRGGRGHRHSSSWLLLAALSIPSLTAVAQEPPQIDATRSAGIAGNGATGAAGGCWLPPGISSAGVASYPARVTTNASTDTASSANTA